MNKDSLEKLVGLVVRIREIVDDPFVTIRINSAVSTLEAAVREQMENRIWQIYRESKELEGKAELNYE